MRTISSIRDTGRRPTTPLVAVSAVAVDGWWAEIVAKAVLIGGLGVDAGDRFAAMLVTVGCRRDRRVRPRLAAPRSRSMSHSWWYLSRASGDRRVGVARGVGALGPVALDARVRSQPEPEVVHRPPPLPRRDRRRVRRGACRDDRRRLVCAFRRGRRARAVRRRSGIRSPSRGESLRCGCCSRSRSRRSRCASFRAASGTRSISRATCSSSRRRSRA